MKSDIEHFKWLFQIEDNGGIGGKCTCVHLIATVLFWLVLGKEKPTILVTSSELHLVFDQFTQYKEQNFFFFFTFIVDRGWR